jgi:CHAD domain-containing protein
VYTFCTATVCRLSTASTLHHGCKKVDRGMQTCRRSVSRRRRPSPQQSSRAAQQEHSHMLRIRARRLAFRVTRKCVMQTYYPR